MRNRALIGTILGVSLLAGAVIGPSGAAAVVGPTDLVLTKNDSADPVVEDTNFSYTIQVKNQGANDASGVVVTDNLPSQVSYVSSTSTVGSCSQAGKTVTCTMGQVNAGITATITIVVKASKSGTASNTASLASPDDTVPGNNQDTETTVISKKTPKGKAKKVAPSCAAPTISGTAGDDTIMGTAGNDVIRGFAGNDTVFGNGGSDLICTNLGADRVFGGPGADAIVGGPGPDRLFGGTGGDLIKGSSGRDLLRGQIGNDALNGGRGSDNCKGGAGHDTLRSCP
jgi:uncharacterized repeat protein (TIGR01451 family)